MHLHYTNKARNFLLYRRKLLRDGLVLVLVVFLLLVLFLLTLAVSNHLLAGPNPHMDHASAVIVALSTILVLLIIILVTFVVATQSARVTIKA
jgi:heme/copper-type cytochrome/quinol oxidase subunit 2